jgi:DNA-binding PucR family transcriptional regulator
MLVPGDVAIQRIATMLAARRAELASESLTAIRAAIPAYGDIDDPVILADVTEHVAENNDALRASLVRGRPVTEQDLPFIRPHADLDDTPAVRRFVEDDTAAGGALTSTLLAYAAANLNAKVTAQRLFIHVNTAHHRLTRIEERTGCDLRDLAGVQELLIAIRLARHPIRTTTAGP